MSTNLVPIPSTIDEVTPAWLASATGLPIETAEITQIGVGIGVSSALFRARLTGGTGCPESVIIKMPALDEAAVFTSTVLRMYIREVRFFEQLAAESPVRVPKGYHGAVDEETSSFVVVMEDMGTMRMVDQLDGMELADAERAVDELAAWHATWWGKPSEGLAAAGTTVSLGDPVYPAVLPFVFAEGWEKVTTGMDVHDAILDVGPRFADAIPGLLAHLSQGPNTVTHGDFRADNILFGPDGSIVLLDFQLIGTGSGAYDLAYFITQSLRSEDASAHERDLFDRWIAGLRAGGVADEDLGRMWEDYRVAALFCLVYPIVASRGMDLDDPRQRNLLDCMNERFVRAVTELDLASLL
ncbi:MAG TPA: phosphotransferase [Acidimicrobiales bacterium]|nr:phosphotransferase [Acidimicrobiales bacterium]